MKFKYSNQKFAFAATGGGSLFFSDILCAGGASEFLVSAVIPYDTKALEKYVGGVREKPCSCSTARQLAVAAEKQAMAIGVKAIGVGATCSLTKGAGEREGREHRIFVAASFKEHSVSIEWKHDGQKYTRMEEEQIASKLIRDVAERFGAYVNDKTHLINSNIKDKFIGLEGCKIWSEVNVRFPSDIAIEKMSTLMNFARPLAYYCEECFNNLKRSKNVICIYPGSWNPIHEDHRQNFATCERLYGAENCFLELSIENFEKPNIDSIELTKRLADMRGLTKNILITTEPKFAGKINEIKINTNAAKVVFAVGMDTFVRIEPLGDICSFLVFPRNGKRVSPVNFSGNTLEKESFNLTEGLNLSSSSLRRQ